MSKRILVVEDNPVIRRSMLQQLSQLGVNCYAVENGEEAVKLAEFFDLILMDVQLPGMSGIEAAKQIRKAEAKRRLRPVAIVATTTASLQRECVAAGMDEFCPKPIKASDLERLLNRWIFSAPERERWGEQWRLRKGPQGRRLASPFALEDTTWISELDRPYPS